MMNAYMLKGTHSDGSVCYYQRSGGQGLRWVDQEIASIWTSERGPNSAKGAIARDPWSSVYIKKLEVEKFALVKVEAS